MHAIQSFEFASKLWNEAAKLRRSVTLFQYGTDEIDIQSEAGFEVESGKQEVELVNIIRGKL